MEFIFTLLGFIVLLGVGLAFAAHKLREQSECAPIEPKYCCYCGNRLIPSRETHAADASVDADG
jgi:hypothetical protein